MKLKLIDLWCSEHKTPRGVFLVNTALSVINAKGGVRCEMQGCRNPSIGKYDMVFYDYEAGETQRVINICEYHLKKAKGEGVGVNEHEEGLGTDN